MAQQIDRFSNRPRRNPDSAHQPVAEDGGLVVLPTTAEVKVLNPVGSFLWPKLDGEHTQSDLVQAIIAEFDVDEDQAQKDLFAFLEQLEREQMLAPPQAEKP